jgi:transposase
VQALVGALGLDSLVAALNFTGFLDKDAFEVFVRDVLVPALKPGQVVVLARLNVHKKKATLALIEAVGARVLFLPRATPELNPIEHCWAKIKAFLRRCAPRTVEGLELAVELAMASITAQDCWGFLAGCGYMLTVYARTAVRYRLPADPPSSKVPHPMRDLPWVKAIVRYFISRLWMKLIFFPTTPQWHPQKPLCFGP